MVKKAIVLETFKVLDGRNNKVFREGDTVDIIIKDGRVIFKDLIDYDVSTAWLNTVLQVYETRGHLKVLITVEQ